MPKIGNVKRQTNRTLKYASESYYGLKTAVQGVLPYFQETTQLAFYILVADIAKKSCFIQQKKCCLAMIVETYIHASKKGNI